MPTTGQSFAGTSTGISGSLVVTAALGSAFDGSTAFSAPGEAFTSCEAVASSAAADHVGIPQITNRPTNPMKNIARTLFGNILLFLLKIFFLNLIFL